jgi:hypothetical protein
VLPRLNVALVEALVALANVTVPPAGALTTVH